MKVKEKRKVNNRPRKIKFGLLKKLFFVASILIHYYEWIEEAQKKSKQASFTSFSFLEHEMITSLMLDGENIKGNSWNKLSHNERKIMTHNQVIALSTT